MKLPVWCCLDNLRLTLGKYICFRKYWLWDEDVQLMRNGLNFKEQIKDTSGNFN